MHLDHNDTNSIHMINFPCCQHSQTIYNIGIGVLVTDKKLKNPFEKRLKNIYPISSV